VVGLVIVSHSAALARGVRELAMEMTQGRGRIAVAGGMGDPDHPMGTDPMRVLAAIEEVHSGDGVLVLMDMGSALMSAETALELLEPEKAALVKLSAAPLVEGAVAAAVQAFAGASLVDVEREALAALCAKTAQLGLTAVEGAHGALPPGPAGALPEDSRRGACVETLQVVVPNELGFHARPAARIVGALSGLDAEVWVTLGEKKANARSVNQLSMLGARQGDRTAFRASGPDARRALDALRLLADANFGDAALAPALIKQSVQEPPGGPGGVGASDGYAVGPAAWLSSGMPDVERRTAPDAGAELQRLNAALEKARQELTALENRAAKAVGKAEAEILGVQRLLLQDPDILAKVRDMALGENINAEAAWHAVITATAGEYRALGREYMRERAPDVLDVGARVLRHLLETPDQGFAPKSPCVLLAMDLGPSDVAGIADASKVLGIVTARGGATSHAAILARSMGIPAVTGAGDALSRIEAGRIVGLDGGSGRLWLSPTAEDREMLLAKRARWLGAKEASLAWARADARTADGMRVRVLANIGKPGDAAPALAHGAEGVGLFRTEYLFLDRADPPGEEEQTRAYEAAAAAMAGRPVIIRTLDIGGDKPAPYVAGEVQAEDNPFLGLRGIRLCLARRDIFLTQLRALLRVGAVHPIRVMFPMVAHPGELEMAKALMDEARASLAASGTPHAGELGTGVMIEVPSAVALADQLAERAAFFSIGTNDLAQYVMAADRGNPAVAGLSDALHPAVLRMVRNAARAARAAGIPVGVCGELAGRAQAIPLLIGLGVDDLSMSAPLIPEAKARIAALTVGRCEALAAKALALPDAAAVRRLLARWS
jgi:phosphocarrier protein FPr